MVAGAGDPHLSPNLFVQGDSISLGQHWESQGAISFDKLKLTNNRSMTSSNSSSSSSPSNPQICLHSMHKYLPKIHVQEVSIDTSTGKNNISLHVAFNIHKYITYIEPRGRPQSRPVVITILAYVDCPYFRLYFEKNKTIFK